MRKRKRKRKRKRERERNDLSSSFKNFIDCYMKVLPMNSMTDYVRLPVLFVVLFLGISTLSL
jgi:hypothetical protein